jgi:hypothetical protein
MKLGKGLFFSPLILIFFLCFFLSTCSKQNDTAHIIIDLESDGLAAAEMHSSLADRIINILTLSRTAHADAPSNITSYMLTVSGPDLVTITAYYPAGTSRIVADVPAGNSREVSVTANIDPSDPRAVLAYRGSIVVDLKKGESRDVALTMVPSETKIAIPDLLRNRVVQTDDMKGSNWKTLVQADLASGIITYTYKPSDIAFDAGGRMYIANNSASSYDTGIIRIGSISGGASAAAIVTGKDVTGIQWIAIDMKKAILYFATSTVLYSSGIDGSGITSRVTISSGSIYGINVDDNGQVYIVYTNGGGTNIVARYNPLNFAAAPVTFDFSAHYGSNNYNPKDVVIKSGRVYVAVNGYSLAAQEIVELNSKLQYVGSFGAGTAANPDTAFGHFYGPVHFVARLNRKLVIIDDGAAGGAFDFYADKLVSIDTIDGENWETFGSSGGGVGQFGFYYGC